MVQNTDADMDTNRPLTSVMKTGDDKLNGDVTTMMNNSASAVADGDVAMTSPGGGRSQSAAADNGVY